MLAFLAGIGVVTPVPDSDEDLPGPAPPSGPLARVRARMPLRSVLPRSSPAFATRRICHV